MNKRKIYFAGSICGGRDDAQLYAKVIECLKNYGEVLTEHIGSCKVDSLGERSMGITAEEIHDRDVRWLLNADVIVADVTQVSMGVGYELGMAVENNKNILCLYREQEGKTLSAMILGSKKITTIKYKNIDDIKIILKSFFG